MSTHLWQATAAAMPKHAPGASSIPIASPSKAAWIPNINNIQKY
jgi:hypothetical protein